MKYKQKKNFHQGVNIKNPFPCDICKELKEKTALTLLNKMLICPSCLPSYSHLLYERHRKKKKKTINKIEN